MMIRLARSSVVTEQVQRGLLLQKRILASSPMMDATTRTMGSTRSPIRNFVVVPAGGDDVLASRKQSSIFTSSLPLNTTRHHSSGMEQLSLSPWYQSRRGFSSNSAGGGDDGGDVCPVTGQKADGTIPQPPIPPGAPAPPVPPPPPMGQAQKMAQNNPPSVLTEEMALGIHAATQLFIRHGLGKTKLTEISKGAGDISTLVIRWQHMMEVYLGIQVHVLAGLGYPPDEKGIGLYTAQLGNLMVTAHPDMQEELRTASRDLWREVLSTAFNVDLQTLNESSLSIVDARNIMHKVAQKMMEPSTLESISQKISKATASAPSEHELILKHTIVQEVMVHEVYLGGHPTLVSECGFGDGEVGYVQLQGAITEYQSDPLVSQYVSGAMMRILQAAGLDGATRQMADAIAQGGGDAGKN